MIERGNGARFLLEAAETIGVMRERVGEDFEGDVASEASVAGAIDFTHPAGAERRDDFVRSEFGSRLQTHARARL
jgi:hypothetical protein